MTLFYLAMLAVHIGAGLVALIAGGVAMVAPKGQRWHNRAGNGFVAAMVVLGLSASALEPFRGGSPLGGFLVCYFVLTAWQAARRRDGRPGRLEQVACAFILLAGLAVIWRGIELGQAATPPTEPPSPMALIVMGSACLLAGLLDLKYILQGRLSPRQRIGRHVWRICVAFFIATGSFFLGQMDVLPAAMRESMLLLLLLAFAPLLAMIFWIVRVRLAGKVGRLKLGGAASPAAAEPAPVMA
jgi:uncharacterized membrane protein